MCIDEEKWIELWRGLLEGREPETTQFCLAMIQRVTRLYRSRERDEECLKDRVQSFMQKLVEREKKVARSYDPAQAPLWAYFRIVALRHFYDKCQDDARRARREIPLDVIFDLPAQQRTDDRIREEELEAAIAQIKRSEDRLCFHLRIQEGLKEREISEIFSIPPGTVSTRIRRTRMELRKLLRRRGYDVPGD